MKVSHVALICLLPLLLSACSETGDPPTTDSPFAKQLDVWTEATRKLAETAWRSAKGKARIWSRNTEKVCKAVDAAKEEAVAVTGSVAGLVTGATATASAAGVSAVTHSSGAIILTGSSGYISGTLGTAGTAMASALTAPAVLAATAVSVVAVGGAIYICTD
jgi:hypothetical protein